MATRARWWQTAPVKGLASLAIALSVTFLPLIINMIRARRSAPAVEIVASPGVVADSLGGRACDSVATDSAGACKPATTK